jgi:hypothetical protein
MLEDLFNHFLIFQVIEPNSMTSTRPELISTETAEAEGAFSFRLPPLPSL